MAANTRTLWLPHGGSVDIPLPGSNAKFEMNPAALAFSDGSSRMPTIVICLVLGAAVGTAATVWYLRRRRA